MDEIKSFILRILTKLKAPFLVLFSEKFSIKHKGSWIPKVVMGFLVLCLVYMVFISRLFIPNEIAEAHSQLNKYNELGTDGSVKIEKWEWNKKNKTMDIVLKYKQDYSNGLDTKFKYKPIANNQPDKVKQYKIVEKTSNKEAIRIYDVNPDFQVMVLKILSSNQDTEDELQLYGNENKVKKVFDKELKTTSQYKISFIDSDIKDNKNKIVKSKNSINNKEKKIDDLSNDISKIEEEKEYQTKDEKLNSDNNIENKKLEQEELSKGIDDIKKRINEHEQSIKLLNKKREDTLKFN